MSRAIAEDVTHLRVLRDAKLVETKFRDLLESTPEAIIMANDSGRIVLANSQAEALFGYERGELPGQLVELLLPSRYRGGHVAHRSGYFAQPRTRSMGAGLEKPLRTRTLPATLTDVVVNRTSLDR